MIFLRTLLLESDSNNTISQEVESLEKSINQKYSEVLDRFMIYYDKYTKAIELTDIYLKPEFYGKDHGSKIMTELVQFADSKKLPIILVPESEAGENKRLVNFYKKFGFVVNAGRNKDFALSVPSAMSMYRLPRG